jgi:hypothetical protein
MQMFFIIITIALSTGIGFFAVKDRADNLADRTQITRADVAAQQNAYFMRALRREVSLNPGDFRIPAPGGIEKISPQIIDNITFGGYRNLDIVDYVLDETGKVLATTRPLFERGPGIGGSSGRDEQSTGQGQASTQDWPVGSMIVGRLDKGTMSLIEQSAIQTTAMIAQAKDYVSARDRISGLLSAKNP